MAIEVTDQAAERIRELAARRDADEPWLRIGIRGGGCSGFSYFLDFVDAPGEADKRFQPADGVNLCVDKKSYLFLNGLKLDFERTLVRTGFVFQNPMAESTCSCGESFSVAMP